MVHHNSKIVTVLAGLLFLVATAAMATALPLDTGSSGYAVTEASPSLAGNWIEKANTTKAGALGEAVVGTGDYIYIVWCRYRTKQPEFWRYDPIEDKWNYSMNTSDLSTGAFRNGAALAWDGYDGCIYAMMGSRSHKNGTRFARYNCSSNLWENLTMPESWKNKTDDGASLVWTGREYLYALQGEIGERKPHKPITNFSRIIFLPLAGEAE